uniref:Uncharacterized protein n=1 Tax=Anguilla anguilla TaxID=7936 RepID=A0A0E9S703_ANGAN
MHCTGLRQPFCTRAASDRSTEFTINLKASALGPLNNQHARETQNTPFIYQP